jgi:hypothetical protein
MRLVDDKLHPLTLAMQAMAMWYLALGLVASAFTLALVMTGASLEDKTYGISGMKAAEIAGGSLAAALILGGLACAMLGRAFWHPRWSLILIPGLIGTVATGLFEYVDWPASYLLGGAVAYWMVRRQIERASLSDSANS